MSSVSWTREQRQAIEWRGSNLLVSAAAGSGKTAVLVERIIRMVTDPEHPADIDRLLVMTFTNAAAAEMRSRIGEAIRKKLLEHPEDGHLQMQESLIHYAQITTIDSFCLNLIRTYFSRLDLDPSFRVGDEGELMLLRQDVMNELLEDWYGRNDAEFERFVNTYATGKSDAVIEEYLLRVYTFAQSNPWPQVWLTQCRQELKQLSDPQDFEGLSWVRFLREDIRCQAKELSAQLAAALAVCEDDEYLNAYAPMLANDVRRLDGIAAAETLRAQLECLAAVRWDTLARVRSKEADAQKKQYVTGCRDRAKKIVKKLQELYTYAGPEVLLRDLAASERPVAVLLTLAEEFSRRYQEKKRDRNVVDFNDLEHEALKVLIRQDENGLPLTENGSYLYTEVADELAAQYLEVMVDEYQDSNLVQEALVGAVSAKRFGRPDVFLVGDVKQSIYRFRLARPELFLEKYRTYVRGDSAEGAPGRLIELHQNFRSRREVLDGINGIFYRIMTENPGGIRYTEETALHAGAQFEPLEGRTPVQPELYVVNTEKEILKALDDDAAELTVKEIEGRLIAEQIRRLTDPESGFPVWDKALNGTGGYRTARFGDIVILLRSMADWTETLLAVLQSSGIPAYAESQTGYFNTVEVETVLSVLAVIDNPMQDIPLAAVLRSPVVGLSDAELAALMARFRGRADKGQDRGICAAVLQLLADGPEGLSKEERSLRERLSRFWEELLRFRKESAYLPIHELIYRVYERTGYYDYASAMPAGQARQDNLDMLVEKAAAYEKTSYQGLFHFIRYVENLKKYNTDFGEAQTAGENDDTVRIMSIHKSKGLEFPIVILAGMGKRFNRQDLSSRILIDADFGIAADWLDPELRLKAPTIKKNALRRKQELDSLGEELRVLYVAMTRAKERLILTATDRSFNRNLERYGPGMLDLADGQLPGTVLCGASSFLDWLWMSLGAGPLPVSLREVPVEDLVGAEAGRQAETLSSRERLLRTDFTKTQDAATERELAAFLEAEYPWQADVGLYTKMSVSELKKLGQMTDEAESVQLFSAAGTTADGEGPAAVPGTFAPSGRDYAATRGTAYHRALELLDFAGLHSAAETEAFLDALAAAKRLDPESRALVRPQVLWGVLSSGLGRRMARAAAAGKLRRECQFVMGVPARELGDYDSDELVVVQGIIDAWFEEDGEPVLVDYKTDRVQDVKTLAVRYRTQMDSYARALERLTGRKVREKIIYSLALQQEVRCGD